jgi:hypothetical protein
MAEDKALAFFQRMKAYLGREIGPAADVRSEVEQAAHERRGPQGEPAGGPEEAFLNMYLAPHLHAFMTQELGDASRAREAILCESTYARTMNFASNTPARTRKHPFTKVLGQNGKIVAQWKGQGKGSPIIQSCPDLALHAPANFNAVFECKYFSNGGIEKAETVLVTSIYEAFFYRALPPVPETGRRPSWGYEYACLLAYDASEKGSLLKAWARTEGGFHPDVRKACWSGGNVYVMILGGDSQWKGNRT